MSIDKKLHKVLDIWLSIFEESKGKLSDKQIEKFLHSEDTKEIANFSEKIVRQSMEYAYSINTSKLKDIFDIAVNKKYKPQIAQSIKVDVDELNTKRKREAKNTEKRIYSEFVEKAFGKITSDESAETILDYLDLAEWVKFWSDGSLEKIKCGGGSCGISSNGKLKKIYKFAHIAKNNKQPTQYIYTCDLNLGFHLSTFKDSNGDNLSEISPEIIETLKTNQDFSFLDESKIRDNVNILDVFFKKMEFSNKLRRFSVESIYGIKYKDYKEEVDNFSQSIFGLQIDWNAAQELEEKRKSEFINEDWNDLIEDKSGVLLDKNGKIVLGKEGYPIRKRPITLEILQLETKNSIWGLGPVDVEVVSDDALKKVKINNHVVYALIIEKDGSYAMKNNAEARYAYPKYDENGYITLDEDDNILFTEFESK